MSGGGAYDPKAIEPDIYAMWEAGGYFHAEAEPSVAGLREGAAAHGSEPGDRAAERGASPGADGAGRAARKPYTIVIPPPNVTGALHLGHAINNTLQDILIRHKRMCGYNAEWMPGTDHAGIATQAVVERRLAAEQDWRRDTRNPEHRKFLVDKIWEWKEEYSARILGQLRKMGCSCDWPRTRFTLDERYVDAVYHTFFELFKAGLIYRGTRLVNWDAALQTAVSDDEVVYETVKGHFWHFRYPLLDGEYRSMRPVREDVARAAIGRATRPEAALAVDYMAIATTRPETMLGDVALCVHPDDARYKHLIGRHVLLPLMSRAIPIIADGELAKMELGTGCVKVTPGHDPKDYACGQRNNLPMVNILTPDGRINENGGPYRDAPKEQARKRVVGDLEGLGLVEKIEAYQTEVGHSDRSKTPIEPMLSEQWFMKMSALADATMEPVRDGRVRFFPERFAKTYLDWLGEKRDWCISRQLWWGHRIPVWNLPLKDPVRQSEVLTLLSSYFTEWGGIAPADYTWRAVDSSPSVAGLDITLQICGRTAAVRDALSALESLFAHVLRDIDTRRRAGEPSARMDWSFFPRQDVLQTARRFLDTCQYAQQDPDVLDTWFSSALWPMATFGWPHGAEARRDEGMQAPSGSGPSCVRASVSACPSPTDFAYFFPTDVLVTGRGIITLWVARMVMMSLYFEKRVPFRHVYIYPTIQDALGRTMSKSLGNGVDPIDLIDRFGADAMRFVLTQMATETQDVRVPVSNICPHCGGETLQPAATGKYDKVEQMTCRHCKKPFATSAAPEELRRELGVGPATSERFELGRNFCNKLWQATNGLILPALGGRHGGTEARRHEGTEARGHEGGGGESGAGGAEQGGEGTFDAEGAKPLRREELEMEDRWILSRLSETIAECDRRLASYQLSDVANAIYGFFWSDFCDWYLELVKPRLRGERQEGGGRVAVAEARRREGESGRTGLQAAAHATVSSSSVARQVLAWVLDQTLRLLHPIAPFITEALWRKLNEVAPRRGIGTVCEHSKALIVAAWPDAAAFEIDTDVEREMASLQDVIRALRDIRTSVNALRSVAKQPALRALPRAVVRADAGAARRMRRDVAVLLRLGTTDALDIGPDVAKPPESVSKVLSGGIEVYVPLGGLVDLEIERKRLRKDRDELLPRIEQLTAKLADSGFTGKAPGAVVEKERARLADMRGRLVSIERNLGELGE